MNRREFLKNTGLTVAGSMFLPSFVKALPVDQLMGGYKRLVIIQLSGGNDGLNTVIPLGQDPYYDLRPQLSLKNNELIKVGQNFGLNSALSPLTTLLEKGEWGIISDVGYPNPNRSHFRSMDIWQSASEANEYLNTGWIGRYLDQNNNSKSIVLEIDSKLSLANMGNVEKAISFTDPEMLHKAVHMGWVNTAASSAKDMLSENNLGYLYQTLANVYQTSDYLLKKYNPKDIYKDFGNSKFGKNLKLIADLMIAGADTKVYYTSMSGFDTHANQKPGQHRLLSGYSSGVSAFVESLKKENLFDDTLILTFSEFGRRVKQNASNGTDHGTANPVFVMGGKLKKNGLINGPSNLLKLDKNDLIYRVDFRSIYAEILDKWLGVEPEQLISNLPTERVDFL